MKGSYRLFSILIITATTLLIRCANPVSPTGGPKDELPPHVLMTDPPQNTTNFDNKNIALTFDEYLSLKNPATEIFISPPQKKIPETRLRGKTLLVEFEDSLATNTTYSISFGNSITDLNEGNILTGYNYVFSTGNYIDSLSVKGNILNAFDLKPVKDVIVGIYLDNRDTLVLDSLPLYKAPWYITRSDENGRFIFNNIQDKPCKLFAISDLNGDLIFNQPTEKIAFLKELVTPVFISRPSSDTLQSADSVSQPDTLKIKQPGIPEYQMLLFEQSDSIQRLLKSGFTNQGLIMLNFRFPVNNLHIKTLSPDSAETLFLTEYFPRNDTVLLWLTKPEIDTITLVVSARRMTPDTLEITWSPQERRGKKDNITSGNRLFIQSPQAGFTFNHYKKPQLLLGWNFPLTQANFDKFLLVDDKDTLKPGVEYADSLHRFLKISHPWKEDTYYKLLIPDSACKGLNKASHDTINFTFRTKAEKDVGNLILSLNLPATGGNYLIQLWNEKESGMYEQVVASGQEKVRFDFMSPGKYRLKAVNDINRNNRWDAGHYQTLLLPEEVFYYPKPIEIRGNWDVEESWISVSHTD